MSGERVLTGAARVENAGRGTRAGLARAPAGGSQSLASQIAALMVAHAEVSRLPPGGAGDASALTNGAKRASSRRRTGRAPAANAGPGRLR
jgi:hypothetical protein